MAYLAETNLNNSQPQSPNLRLIWGGLATSEGNAKADLGQATGLEVKEATPRVRLSGKWNGHMMVELSEEVVIAYEAKDHQTGNFIFGGYYLAENLSQTAKKWFEFQAYDRLRMLGNKLVIESCEPFEHPEIFLG